MLKPLKKWLVETLKSDSTNYNYYKTLRGWIKVHPLCILLFRYSITIPMIIGEIRRYLRDNNSVKVSRTIKDTAYKAMQAKERIIAKTQREPTVSEIAEELEAKREDIVVALESIVDPVSLYEPAYSDNGDAVYILDQVGDKNDDKNWLCEIAIRDAISHLSSREKHILSLRFMYGKTQMEVSNEIGISQAQVSRLEKMAIEKIKS